MRYIIVLPFIVAGMLIAGCVVETADSAQPVQAEINDGGAAFPNPDYADTTGMTLRDYFAATAPPYWYGGEGGSWYSRKPGEEAKWRYEYADAMLKERAK